MKKSIIKNMSTPRPVKKYARVELTKGTDFKL